MSWTKMPTIVLGSGTIINLSKVCAVTPLPNGYGADVLFSTVRDSMRIEQTDLIELQKFITEYYKAIVMMTEASLK